MKTSLSNSPSSSAQVCLCLRFNHPAILEGKGKTFCHSGPRPARRPAFTRNVEIRQFGQGEGSANEPNNFATMPWDDNDGIGLKS